MIDFYTWFTPNGRKVAIMLEETGLDYTVHPIAIGGNVDQFTPEFTKISPNNKIPAIVDHDTNISLMESGAILMYLGEKTGKFFPTDEKKRWQTIEWLMWQMGGLGPMLGQVHHFTRYNPGKDAYGEERYMKEGKRLYEVLDRHLGDREFVAGDYSIADMACWPWIARHNWQTIDLNDYPNVKRWYMAIVSRPAVVKAWNIPENDQPLPIPE
ncbi:MAG: glutathione S-transferase N-terminal domain-containing protein [Rhodospirillales bacterium]|nr:glutathione S-transferase N-terminal domain-containing protein [Rhodospirillales bacterium]